MKETFWVRKWGNSSKNIQEKTTVVLEEDNVYVFQWPLGRTIKTSEWNNGLLRLVKIFTSSGVLKPSIQKLAPLFSNKKLKVAAREIRRNSPEMFHKRKRTSSSTQKEVTKAKCVEKKNSCWYVHYTTYTATTDVISNQCDAVCAIYTITSQ